MFVASYSNTMANARQIVDDEGFQRRTPRRDRLNALSLEWEARRKTKLEAEKKAREQAAADIAKWKRKHRRTRFEVKEARTPHGDMIARVAAWHGMTADQVQDTNQRSKPIVAARRDAIAAVWCNCLIEQRKPSLPAMGRAFNADHTSILAALRKCGLRPEAQSTPKEAR
jgi:hypothetical protein